MGIKEMPYDVQKTNKLNVLPTKRYLNWNDTGPRI